MLVFNALKLFVEKFLMKLFVEKFFMKFVLFNVQEQNNDNLYNVNAHLCQSFNIKIQIIYY